MIDEQTLRRILHAEADRHVVNTGLRKSTAVKARASRAGRVAGVGAIVATIMVAGVGVANHLTVGRADVQPPAEGGPGEESEARIDRRVLNGVAPVSGDSMGSVRWLEKQMFRLKLPAVSECLRRKDREDLLPDVEADFEANLNIRSFYFPEPQRLLEEGFVTSSEAPFNKRGREEDLAVADSCSLDIRPTGEREAQTQALHQSLHGDWTMILVDDVLKSDAELAAQQRFGQCLRRHGVPDEFTVADAQGSPGGTVEDAFLGWVTGPKNVEEARLYVRCGRPLWDTRERLLRERRETYVERHHDQLVELSHLL